MYKWKFFQDCYMNRKRRGSLSSSSRESVKQTSLSAKKQNIIYPKVTSSQHLFSTLAYS